MNHFYFMSKGALDLIRAPLWRPCDHGIEPHRRGPRSRRFPPSPTRTSTPFARSPSSLHLSSTLPSPLAHGSLPSSANSRWVSSPINSLSWSLSKLHYPPDQHWWESSRSAQLWEFPRIPRSNPVWIPSWLLFAAGNPQSERGLSCNGRSYAEIRARRRWCGRGKHLSFFLSIFLFFLSL